MRRKSPSERQTGRPSGRAAPVVGPEADVLALQRLAGNAAVSSLVARAPKRAPKPPDPAAIGDWEVRDVIETIRNRRLDEASVRAIQDALGMPATGSFTAADALALSRFRLAHRMGAGTTFDRRVLDAIVKDRVAVGMEQEMIHLVADWEDLDTRSDTLSVRFDPTATVASTVSFDLSELRSVGIGKAALKDSRSIRKAIRAALAEKPPSFFLPAPPARAVPTLLTADEAEGAAGFNASILGDRRAVIALQRIVGAPTTGTFDATTSQFIADLQRSRRFRTRDGTIDDELFHFVVDRLDSDGDRDALIRLVVSYRGISEEGVVGVAFDSGLARDFAVASGGTGSPTTLTFGASGFGASQQAEAIVHTIAHGYEDARLRLTRHTAAERRFLGAKLEVLSVGMGEELFGDAGSGFVQDATEALRAFEALDRPERIRLWTDFEQVRDKVYQRFGQASAADHDNSVALLRAYQARRAP